MGGVPPLGESRQGYDPIPPERDPQKWGSCCIFRAGGDKDTGKGNGSVKRLFLHQVDDRLSVDLHGILPRDGLQFSLLDQIVDVTF